MNYDKISKRIEKDKAMFVGNEIEGKTLGVVGLGAIGGKVVNAALALGMKVREGRGRGGSSLIPHASSIHSLTHSRSRLHPPRWLVLTLCSLWMLRGSCPVTA
jgi:hypothetical protein